MSKSAYFKILWAGEMAHQVKVIATNPEDLSLIHGTHIVERTDSQKLFFNLQTCMHPYA